MRILLFIHSLSGGGAERVLSLLANHWAKEGHDISIAINQNKDSIYRIDERIKIVNVGVEQSGTLANIKRIQNYKATMQEINPDVIISFMTSMNILTTIAARSANIPILISERNTYNHEKSKVWRFLRRSVYPFSTLLIVQTTYEMSQYKFIKNIRKIENPLTIPPFEDVKREKIVIAVGRLEHSKGFDMLINAYSKLKNAANWHLVILGEGSERNSLENQIKELKLENNISLPGRSNDVASYYKKSSVFVLSSRIEGFPNVLCEAMAYGCPPIAFDCLTGPREIIENNKNGILIEADNTDELSLSLETLMDDQTKRDNISTEARKILSRLDISLVSKKWMQCIDEAISQ